MNPIELNDQLQAFKLTDLYKELVGQLNNERDGLRASYECKTLTELATLKGLAQGLDRINQRMRQIELEAEKARAVKRAEEERALKNVAPQDSSEL